MSLLILQDTDGALPDVKAVLEKAQARIGKTPNMIRAMANAPVVAEIYLSILDHLEKGSLTPQFRELLALVAAQENQCDYCLRAHAAKGAKAGLARDDIRAATHAESADPKIDIALKFAREIIQKRSVSPAVTIPDLKNMGWSEKEISEIIAVTTLNIFPNYFNKLNQTPVDFPEMK